MSGWTQQEFEEAQARCDRNRGITSVAVAPEKASKPRAQRYKTETAFEDHLALRFMAGEIEGWSWQDARFHLGGGVFFTPDFTIRLFGGEKILVDVKTIWRGATRPHIERDAQVRIKLAAAKYPQWQWCQCWQIAPGVWESKRF